MELKKAPWGMSANFEAVFTKLILPMAVKKKLPQDQMVKRIFVFSDIQFNQADSNLRNSYNWARSPDAKEEK